MNTSLNNSTSDRFGLLRETLGATAALSAAVVLTGLLFIAFAAIGTGCTYDEPVGQTTTVEKKVVDTPTEKTTTTEVHEKETKIIR